MRKVCLAHEYGIAKLSLNPFLLQTANGISMVDQAVVDRIVNIAPNETLTIALSRRGELVISKKEAP